MAGNQWGDENQWLGYGPDGGGSPSVGNTIAWNPKTGRFEPTTRQGGGAGAGSGVGPGFSSGGGSSQTLPTGANFAGTDLTPAGSAAGGAGATSGAGATTGAGTAGGGGTGAGVAGNTAARTALGGASNYLANNYGWIAALGQLGLGAYQASQSPSYHQVPLSPEMSALYTRYIKAFDNPATRYNAGIASDLAKSEIPRIGANLPWNRTDRMPQAYMGLTPPSAPASGSGAGTGGGGMSSPDFQKIIQQSTNAQRAWMDNGTTTPPPTDAGAGAGGGNVLTWLSQHPEITSQGSSAIAQALVNTYGISPQIAEQIAGMYSNEATMPMSMGLGQRQV